MLLGGGNYTGISSGGWEINPIPSCGARGRLQAVWTEQAGSTSVLTPRTDHTSAVGSAQHSSGGRTELH